MENCELQQLYFSHDALHFFGETKLDINVLPVIVVYVSLLCRAIRIPESGKFLLLEAEIFDIAQGILNPTNNWNQESSSTNEECGIYSVESRVQDYLGLRYVG